MTGAAVRRAEAHPCRNHRLGSAALARAFAQDSQAAGGALCQRDGQSLRMAEQVSVKPSSVLSLSWRRLPPFIACASSPFRCSLDDYGKFSRTRLVFFFHYIIARRGLSRGRTKSRSGRGNGRALGKASYKAMDPYPVGGGSAGSGHSGRGERAPTSSWSRTRRRTRRTTTRIGRSAR